HNQLGEVAKSALSQARQRLGDDPLAQLFSLSAGAWDQQVQLHHQWRGLACYAMDGTTLRAPDTPENREAFGAQAYASGVVASYPQVRAVSLTATASHLVRAAVFGEYGQNEMRYARELVPQIPDHSLTVFDKGFLSADILLGLGTQGVNRHWLIPARTNLRWEVLAGAAGDYRVRMKVSAQARQQNPALPSHWEARAIETLSRTGKRRTLLTSLMDGTYPAAELVARYNERWRIEVSYRELKQSLLSETLTLRSRTPETVKQEIWGALLAYNLVRLEMAEVAREAKVAPTELSFIRALHSAHRQLCGWRRFCSA
ncbi:MAG: IS4 family transposase, partial [Pseudomonas sp.]